MAAPTEGKREGSLQAPTRHPLDWKNPRFYAEDALNKELERVFDICHGCRRCFALCNAFPTLFDAIDATDSGELEGVDNLPGAVDSSYGPSAPRMSESVVAAPGMCGLIRPASRARAARSVVLTRFPLCPNAIPVPAAVLRNTGWAFSHVVEPVVE